MATPPTLEIEPLRVPISEASPSGRSLAYEPEYDALREARRAEDDAPQGDWQRQTKVAQWDRVIALGAECLARKSKDLQIAAWVTEALGRVHGFAGLRDGFTLLRNLLEDYWESLFPEIDEGDLEPRAAPLEFLNQEKLLPLLIRSLPLTDASGERSYSFLRWQESRTTDNAGKRSAELLAALVAEGKITGEEFDEAAAQTPRRFYEALSGDLDAAQAAYKALDAALDARFGREAPSFGNVRKAFEDCRKVIDPILAARRAGDPAEPETVETGEEPASERDEAGAPEAGGTAPRREPAPRRGRSSAGPIASAEDATARIIEAAAYLRQAEPASPVPFVVVRALRLAETFTLGHPPDPAGLPSPSSETRQRLKQLASEGDWPALLEAAEEALSRPEGRAWLDPHRLALAAMTAGDVDRLAAASAVRRLLQAVLAEYPDLPESTLSDDTPTANAETRAWIESEILPPPQPTAEPEPPYTPPRELPEPADESEEAPADPWEQAVDDVRSGRPNEGLGRLRRAIAQAGTGRDKFRRKLQLAELCLMAGNPRIALPLLEELARQVDEFRLEQWEAEELSARVWGALYRCLRDSGGENGAGGRLQQVYDRLCRLDINQALAFGES